MSSMKRIRHTIIIKDYEFTSSELIVYQGDYIEFLLDESTPTHVEHLLQGILCLSSRSVTLFESPLMTKSSCSKFDIKLLTIGEITVTCKIYPDVICHITVLDDDIPTNSPRSINQNNLKNTNTSDAKAIISSISGKGRDMGPYIYSSSDSDEDGRINPRRREGGWNGKYPTAQSVHVVDKYYVPSGKENQEQMSPNKPKHKSNIIINRVHHNRKDDSDGSDSFYDSDDSISLKDIKVETTITRKKAKEDENDENKKEEENSFDDESDKNSEEEENIWKPDLDYSSLKLNNLSTPLGNNSNNSHSNNNNNRKPMLSIDPDDYTSPNNSIRPYTSSYAYNNQSNSLSSSLSNSLLNKNLSNQSLTNKNRSNTNNKDVIIESDRIIYVEDFQFHPSTLTIYQNESVNFILSEKSLTQTLTLILSLDDLPFPGNLLDSSKSYSKGYSKGYMKGYINMENDDADNIEFITLHRNHNQSYTHTFNCIGTYHLSNEVFRFMSCAIRVEPIRSMLSDRLSSRSSPIPLKGSFPFAVPYRNPKYSPSSISVDISYNSSINCSSMPITQSDSKSDGQQLSDSIETTSPSNRNRVMMPLFGSFPLVLSNTATNLEYTTSNNLSSNSSLIPSNPIETNVENELDRKRSVDSSGSMENDESRRIEENVIEQAEIKILTATQKKNLKKRLKKKEQNSNNDSNSSKVFHPDDQNEQNDAIVDVHIDILVMESNSKSIEDRSLTILDEVTLNISVDKTIESLAHSIDENILDSSVNTTFESVESELDHVLDHALDDKETISSPSLPIHSIESQVENTVVENKHFSSENDSPNDKKIGKTQTLWAILKGSSPDNSISLSSPSPSSSSSNDTTKVYENRETLDKNMLIIQEEEEFLMKRWKRLEDLMNSDLPDRRASDKREVAIIYLSSNSPVSNHSKPRISRNNNNSNNSSNNNSNVISRSSQENTNKNGIKTDRGSWRR